MIVLKKITYVGNDDEFYKEILEHSKTISDILVTNRKKLQKKGDLIDLLLTENSNIIYLDFSHNDIYEEIYDEVIFLKKISRFKGVLFTALLSDTSNKREQQHLFASGFTLAYVKGTEPESFIADSLYMGLEEKKYMVKYAKASGINKNLALGVCSSLARISSDSFHIESDLCDAEAKLQFNLHLFNELEAADFKISSHIESTFLFPFTDSYRLKFPYAGPWDEITNKTIQKETVETWIDNHLAQLSPNNGVIKIVCADTTLYRELFEINFTLAMQIDLCDQVNFNLIKQDLVIKKPPLIFFEIVEDNNNNNMQELADLIAVIKNINNYNPILVILNHSNKVEALQKVFNYDNIVCVPENLNVNLVGIFVERYLQKVGSKNPSNELLFRGSDPLRSIDVEHNVVVTSLTEHEITFISQQKLPYFSVLHLDLPIECFVTIIPAPYDLGTVSSGKHYMGIIHGISEEEKQLLRQFVYQIIFKPIKEFTAQGVKAVFDQKIGSKKNNAQAKEELSGSSLEKHDEFRPFERSKLKGKSKL